MKRCELVVDVQFIMRGQLKLSSKSIFPRAIEALGEAKKAFKGAKQATDIKIKM